MSDPLWQAVFGNDRPVEVEIGPGRGDVLLDYAAADPSTNFYGIEIRRARADAIAARAAALGLSNVRVIAGDARCILTHFVPAASVTAFHVYFPDPWPKMRHRRRRLFQVDLPAVLARTLAPGGRVHLASDLEWLFEEMRRALEDAGFSSITVPGLRSRPITRFERKYAAGQTYEGVYRRPQADAGSPKPQNSS
jgi:tRNA (guanine-N7-)-methyltransferase